MNLVQLPNGKYAYVSSDELYHFGVKGMKWGKRKARPIPNTTSGFGRKSTSVQKSSKSTNSADDVARKEARKQKAIKAAKVGAAVAATALAAYGTYKVSKLIRDKNRQIRVGQELVKAHRELASNASNFNTRGKGYSNQQIATINKYHNAYTKSVLDRAVGTGNYNADNDSMATAIKNIYEHRKRRRG